MLLIYYTSYISSSMECQNGLSRRSPPELPSARWLIHMPSDLALIFPTTIFSPPPLDNSLISHRLSLVSCNTLVINQFKINISINLNGVLNQREINFSIFSKSAYKTMVGADVLAEDFLYPIGGHASLQILLLFSLRCLF